MTDTTTLLARQHTEQNKQRMELDTGTHQVRRKYVVLEQTVHHPEDREPHQMRVSAKAGNQRRNLDDRISACSIADRMMMAFCSGVNGSRANSSVCFW